MALRPVLADDLARLTEIYNSYVVNTPITFDLDPVTVDERQLWRAQFAETGPHRLLVAEPGRRHRRLRRQSSVPHQEGLRYHRRDDDLLCAGSYRPGHRHGDVQRAFRSVARRRRAHGRCRHHLPNDASIVLHERFGFVRAGLMHATGRKLGQYWDVAWYERPMG